VEAAQPFSHCQTAFPSYDAEGIFMATGKTQKQSSSGSALGFEATLWATADKLRGNLDAAEYKHVVLGLIFLKYKGIFVGD
jgi:hypothetical protein